MRRRRAPTLRHAGRAWNYSTVRQQAVGVIAKSRTGTAIAGESTGELQKKENSMGGTRNYPIVIAVGVAVLLFSLVGLAAITGVLPQDITKHNPHTSPLLETTASAAAAKKANCRACGVVASIRPVEVKGEASGAGAVAGGVAGAVVGHEIVDGKYQGIATIAGAAGGALAGNEIEKQVKKHTVYRVTVRMDDGSERTLTHSKAPVFAVGARVRVNGNAIERG
jgi:outer membrane lipoprotein SlyB